MSAFAATLREIVVRFLIGFDIVGIVASHRNRLPDSGEVNLFGLVRHRDGMRLEVEVC